MKEQFEKWVMVASSGNADLTLNIHGEYDSPETSGFYELYKLARADISQALTDMAVQLANAESKCRELAAENTRAKKIISECREYFIAGVMNRIRPTNEGYLHMICDTFEDETPATDAFPAEVRAQGVDIFGDYLNGLGWDELDIKQVREFAAQLRKGAEL